MSLHLQIEELLTTVRDLTEQSLPSPGPGIVDPQLSRKFNQGLREILVCRSFQPVSETE